MNERTAIILGAALGAAAGAFAGYLFLTERGRRLRQDLEPRLQALLRDAGQLRETVERARTAAADGWRAVNDAAAESSRWPDPDQQAPF